MRKTQLCVLTAIVLALPVAEQAQAARSEGAAGGKQGVVRCGGNNFLRLGGTEAHFTSYVLRNFDPSTPIAIDRLRLFDATGAVLLDTLGGSLPPSEEGQLGPANNIINPNQTVQYNSNDLIPFLGQPNRPIQMEVQWSAPKAALSLDAITVRISRQRDPATGQIQGERARHAIECRTTYLK